MITPDEAAAIAARVREIRSAHDWTLNSAQRDLIRRALGPIGDQPARGRSGRDETS